MVKPATPSHDAERTDLFKRVDAILASGTGDVSKKDRAAVKKALIAFTRKFPQDAFLSKISDLPRETLLTFCTQVTNSTASLDLKSLVSQVMDNANKEKVEKNEKVPQSVLMRQILDIFLAENKDWKDVPLTELVTRTYTLSKKSKIKEENHLVMVSMLLEELTKRPPLPIPRDVVNDFLQTSHFLPNSDGDTTRFLRNHGLDALVQKMEQEASLGKTKDDIRKSLDGLLATMAERDRRYNKVRFLNYDQIVNMVEVYKSKPLDLYVIINHWVQGRYTKLLGSTAVAKEDIKTKQSVPVKGYISFTESSERPLLYMILRPWVPHMKEIQVCTDFVEYRSEFVGTEHGCDWYTPSARFYEDSTHPDNQQKGFVLDMKGHQVKILYKTYSGKRFLQDEVIFQEELSYFHKYPAYSLPFLETASKTIPLANLSPKYMGILKDMAVNSLQSALASRLPTVSFDAHTMAVQILPSIMARSQTLLGFLERLFEVVHRLDAGVCKTSDLHRVYHKRLSLFFYRLDQLVALTDGLAFPEWSRFPEEDKKKILHCHTQSRQAFVKRSMYLFRLKLFPLQKISGDLVTPPLLDVLYPEMTEDTLYEYVLPELKDPLDLRIVSGIYMNDAHVEGKKNEVQQTGVFFAMDYIYYRDDLDSGLFVDYPDYYKMKITPPKVMTGFVDEFPDFWQRFDIFLTEMPAPVPQVEELLVAEEQEEELGDEEEEEEAGVLEEYPDFLQEDQEFLYV